MKFVIAHALACALLSLCAPVFGQVVLEVNAREFEAYAPIKVKIINRQRRTISVSFPFDWRGAFDGFDLDSCACSG
jgi:hypothetical protein